MAVGRGPRAGLAPRLTRISQTATYNPFEPGFTDDPYPWLAALREDDPVHNTPLDFWVLTRYDDVYRFLRDPSLSVEERNASPRAFTEFVSEALGIDPDERRSYAMLNRDPPDHTRLRKLVSKAFTPRTIERMREHVQELVDDALDGATARGDGELELIGDLAFPLPFTVISEMLGMPDTDRDRMRELSGVIVRTLEPTFDVELLKRIADAAMEMRAFVIEAIAWKRANPADDMLSAMVAAEDNGDMLSDEELLEQVMLLYIAGHETTVNLIGNGTLALLRNPAQQDRLRADPSLVPNAIEEMLRYDSPVQMSRRITLRDVEVGGQAIPAGTFVALSLASSNRDPRHWGPTADEFDVARPEAHEHVSFGGGAHYCLGAALARLEAQVAVGTLVRRFATLELAGDPVWNGRINLRGLDTLPVHVS